MNINESLREESLLMLFLIGLTFFTQSFIQVSILRREIVNLVPPHSCQLSRIIRESPAYGTNLPASCTGD